MLAARYEAGQIPPPPLWMVVLACIAAMWLGAMTMQGCTTYEEGTTKTKTTRSVETPDERTTTTTTRERKVEDHPR